MTTDSLLTRNGMKLILNRAYKSSPDYNPVSDFKISDDTSVFLESDTDLEENIIPISGAETVDDCETADWTESADATADSLNSTSYKENANSINMGKDGTASTTASYSKTTTSVDGTSKDLCLWVYIADTDDLASSNALTIRFGSDSSNYYQKQYDRSELSDGWNFLKIAISSEFDTTNGSPSISSLDYSYIAFETTNTSDTITSGDLRMDYWHVVESNDYIKSIESGYPQVDENSLIVSMRAKLTTTEANGHAISKIGWFNDDASRLMEGGANFSAISKSSSDILIFVTKRRVRNKS